MHTLADVVAHLHPTPTISSGKTLWPPGLRAGMKLAVPSQSPLLLPRDVVGLAGFEALGNGNRPDVEPELERGLRALLIASPTFVIPLQCPTAEELASLGADPATFRHESPRSVGTAVGVRLGDRTFYGVTRIVALLNGLRMGSTWLLSNGDRWTEQVDEAEEWISTLCRNAAESLKPVPEPGARPWQTVTLLLGGRDDQPRLPPGWKRVFRLIAGLREITLDIRVNPDAARAAIVAELRSKPPDALLVSADWVARTDTFIGPFRAARPGAHAEVFGSADRSMPFEEQCQELILHLREIRPIAKPESGPPDSKRVGWDSVIGEVLALAGEHFVLTERAQAMLPGNLYPKPQRMLDHLTKLAHLAAAYRLAGGNVGSGLSEFAVSNYGIEIALSDAGLSARDIHLEGRSLRATPHVKVDDHKTPDQCGRIYFAIDKEGLRFVVDHIGLHDYG